MIDIYKNLSYNIKENNRQSTYMTFSNERKGNIMLDTINNIVGKINGVAWGWPMIFLLLGTHVFLTIRTGFIQRHTVARGIKLSVTKDPDA